MVGSSVSRDDSINLRPSGRMALLFAGILSSFAQGGLTPVLPAIAAHFSTYPAAGFFTRLLVSSIAAMIVLGAPFVGAIADRIGLRRIMLLSMLIYAIAGCAGFFINNLYLLLATRIFVGLT